MNIKKIIAREGLIMVGFAILFSIAITTGNATLLGFGVFGYPLYLLIRFIIWAIKTLFPQYSVPWNKIEKLMNEQHKYREAFNLIQELEKDQKFKEHYENNKGWQLIKKTCLEGIFLVEIYGETNKLMEEEKYEEAIQLSEFGYKFIMENNVFFTIPPDFAVNFNRHLQNKFKDIEHPTIGQLNNFKKEYIEQLQEYIKDEDAIKNMRMLLDLLITQIACKALKDGKGVGD